MMTDHVPYTVGNVILLVRERLARLRELHERRGRYDLNPVEMKDMEDDPAIHYGTQVVVNAARLLHHPDVDALYALCVDEYGPPIDRKRTTGEESLTHLENCLPKLVANLARHRGCGFNDMLGMSRKDFAAAVDGRQLGRDATASDASAARGRPIDGNPEPAALNRLSRAFTLTEVALGSVSRTLAELQRD